MFERLAGCESVQAGGLRRPWLGFCPGSILGGARTELGPNRFRSPLIRNDGRNDAMDNRTIEQFHATRERGHGCTETDGGPHYFAFVDPAIDGRVCIDCWKPESGISGASS